MTKITSPIQGFSGRTSIGATTLTFTDGVAEHDGDLPDGVKAYLKRTGYGIGSKAASAPEGAPEPADPRKVADEQVGSRLRDAAVDPKSGDYLAPVNAGQANPHGPQVVSPEIHSSQGVRPVKPGDVHVDDADAQDADEKAHTAAATDGTPVTDGADESRPKGNASLEAWQEYARTQGATDEDLDGATRDELRDRYTTS